jgi:hypothetical protein
MFKQILFIFIFKYALSQEKFNIFKSYADSKNQPPQYSKQKKYLRHSIQEYLDPVQKKMYKLRNNPDTSNAMFDSKWSGFDLKANKGTNI